MRRAGLIAVLCLAGAIAGLAALGIFQGQVVPAPKGQDSKWLFVKSRNGNLRRVDISKAKVDYDDAIPKLRRQQAAKDALRPPVVVRVIADQDEDGEWQAKKVLILALEPTEKKPSSRPSAGILTAGEVFQNRK